LKAQLAAEKKRWGKRRASVRARFGTRGKEFVKKGNERLAARAPEVGSRAKGKKNPKPKA
jgi:hypothetical protein